MLLSGRLLGPSLAKGTARYAEGNILWPFAVWGSALTAASWSVCSVPRSILGGTRLWSLFFLIVHDTAAWLLRPVLTSVVVSAAFAGPVVAPDGSRYEERSLYLFAVFTTRHLLATRPRPWVCSTSSRWAVAAAAVPAARQRDGGVGVRTSGPAAAPPSRAADTGRWTAARRRPRFLSEFA